MTNTNDQAKKLALALLHADTEGQVIALLQQAGYWDDTGAWRLYGDLEGNYAIIGNQQARPEAALVEKIVNSVDSRLINECMVRGIDPTSKAAPQSIRQAVARFFEGRELDGNTGGLIADWPQSRQLEQAHNITVAVTGATARNGSPSLTISDAGEGQTPSRMLDTFLSLNRSNKLRIPFVQGKFNMGGTGALKFCGQNSIQLILTRRDPAILTQSGASDPAAERWSFTIVRRERPAAGAGQVRNSVYKYLAPLGADSQPGRGGVLSFSAGALPVMPDKNQPYARDMQHGSVIKLYEYDMKGFKSHALMKGQLLSHLEILLPEIALPVRVHECRAYRGDEARSFANSLVGLTARLAENRGDNLEPGYPASAPFQVRGEGMVAQIYAFREDKADSYRTNEGIIFSINGQTHGSIPKTFFDRSRVKMGRLARSVLVMVDCTGLSVGAREDLFMNSRDRLSNGELRKSIEEELEDIIGKHPGLRELRERRRAEEIEGRLEDSRPLESVLGSIFKNSPSLAKLFLLGQRLSRPHRANGSGGEGGSGGPDEGAGEFHGRPHPTFFRFHNKPDGTSLVRNCEIGRRARIKFDTDVENEYFTRPTLSGQYHIEVVEGVLEGRELDHNLNLYNGAASWSVGLPEDSVSEGDEVVVQYTVTDDAMVEPYVNLARLRLHKKVVREGGGASGDGGSGSGRKGAGSGAEGEGGASSSDGTKEPGGIKFPDIVKVHENDENWRRHKFDDETACVVVEDAEGEEDHEHSIYTFYVNAANKYLKTDMKNSSRDAALSEAKFVYGNVLVGLALIHDLRRRGVPQGGTESRNGKEEETVERVVSATTRALAPFLVPMIDNLGGLSTDEVAGLAALGDEE